ncbi:MAG: hypothetical protein LBR05_00300 [Azoarcus sp.]|nr:hypothetical protein [Azoarcus sp.]
MALPIAPARHFFVVNPVCFYRRQEMDEVIAGIHRFFAAARVSEEAAEYAVHISRFPRDAIGAIRRYAKAAPEGAPLRVYAVGGDGILFDCLNGIVGLPNAELGTMPYGRENNFYHVFGHTDLQLFRALDAQTSAISVPMDTLYCGSNHALSYCLIGLESVANASAKAMSERAGLLRHIAPSLWRKMYVNWGYVGMMSSRSVFRQQYRVWVDDEDWSGQHASINIANSPWYAGDKTAVPEAKPDDGSLDVLASGAVRVKDALRYMNKYVRGGHAEIPEFFAYKRAKRVFVTSDTPLVLDLDGEVFYDKHITVEIKPNAVRIVAPAGASGERA